MGLITETNAQYYAGQQAFLGDNTTVDFICNFNTDLIATTTTTNTNFSITVNGVPVTNYTLPSKNLIRFAAAPATNANIVVQLNIPSIWDNYGSYSYNSLTDIVNNFMVAYVGMDKLIPRCKRSDGHCVRILGQRRYRGSSDFLGPHRY